MFIRPRPLMSNFTAIFDLSISHSSIASPSPYLTLPSVKVAEIGRAPRVLNSNLNVIVS